MDFLLHYIEERDISMQDLSSANPFDLEEEEEDDDDDECENTRATNATLRIGINSIFKEYWRSGGGAAYARSAHWDGPLRAYATNRRKDPVCVGIIMLSRRDERRDFFPHLERLTLNTGDCFVSHFQDVFPRPGRKRLPCLCSKSCRARRAGDPCRTHWKRGLETEAGECGQRPHRIESRAWGCKRTAIAGNAARASRRVRFFKKRRGLKLTF